MSRHTIAHATKPGAYFIVGFDKVPGAFFCQSWSAKQKMSWSDDCFEIDNLEQLGAAVPPELRRALVLEACGDLPWSTVKDWRTDVSTPKECHAT